VSGFLVDTNVISEFVKPQPDPRVIRWLEETNPADLFVSVITYGEIRLGIQDLPLGRRRSALETWLAAGLPVWFRSNLLPITRDIADRWGVLTVKAKKNGIQVATADGLIAATASAHDLTIATRNQRDFAETGVRIFNPWSAE
jgi:predicted nucleic acid-binding protein